MVLGNKARFRILVVLTFGFLLVAPMAGRATASGLREPVADADVRLVLVVDVDDTIRRTNVRNTWASLKAVLDSDTMFAGMNRVLARFVCANAPVAESSEAECLNDRNAGLTGAVRVRYLTGSPDALLRDSVQRFLELNHFFHGPLEMRGMDPKHLNLEALFGLEQLVEFKFRKLAEIAHRYKDATLVALGDNGDRDVQSFGMAHAALGERFRGFIHEVHSYREGDRADAFPTWVTALDLERRLRQAGFATDVDVADLTDVLTHALALRPETALPDWLLCPTASRAPGFIDGAVDGELAALEAIDKHCLMKAGRED